MFLRCHQQARRSLLSLLFAALVVWAAGAACVGSEGDHSARLRLQPDALPSDLPRGGGDISLAPGDDGAASPDDAAAAAEVAGDDAAPEDTPAETSPPTDAIRDTPVDTGPPPGQPGGMCDERLACAASVCREGVCRANAAPVARVDGDLVGAVGVELLMDGGASSDDDGDPLAFAWRLVGAPVGSAATLLAADEPIAHFTPDVPGTYVALLVVSDPWISSAAAVVRVQVPAPPRNGAPIAALQVLDEPPLFVGDVIGLSASAASDPDDDPLSFTWRLAAAPLAAGDGALAFDAAEANLSADAAGTWVVEVTVSDGALRDRAFAAVEVHAPNDPPVAAAGEDRTVATNSRVRLDGLGSHDPDGDDLTYQWTIVEAPGDAIPDLADPDDALASFFAPVAGVYRVQLVVRDALYASAPDEVLIEVKDADLDLTWLRDWPRAGDVAWWVQNIDYYVWRFVPFEREGIVGVRIKTDDQPSRIFEPAGWLRGGRDPIVRWLDGEGLAIVAFLDIHLDVLVAVTPPLIIVPHAAFLDERSTTTARVVLGRGGSDTGDDLMRVQVTARGIEAISTLGGDYPEATRIQVRTSIGASNFGDPVQWWFSPGIGLVREDHEADFAPSRRHLVRLEGSDGPLGGDAPALEHRVPTAAIAIDGSADDWAALPMYWRDPPDDAQRVEQGSGQDLAGLQVARDDQFFYLHAIAHDPPLSPNMSSAFLFQRIQGDLSPGHFVAWIGGQQSGGWSASLQQAAAAAPSVTLSGPGVAEVGATPVGLELKVRLNARTADDLPSVAGVLQGGVVRYQICPEHSQSCTDSASPLVTIDLGGD